MLGSVHGEDSNSQTALGSHGDEMQEEEDLGEKEVIAPQIKIGEDGQIVVDEERYSFTLFSLVSHMSFRSVYLLFTRNVGVIKLFVCGQFI